MACAVCEYIVESLDRTVRVGTVGIGTGGHQQACLVRVTVPNRFAGMMSIERESALETTAKTCQVSPPAAMRRETPQVRLLIPRRQALERQGGQRGRGLSEREARVPAALDQQHRAPAQSQEPGQQRSGETGSKDCHVIRHRRNRAFGAGSSTRA